MTTHELARKLLEGPDVVAARNGVGGGMLEITGFQNIELARDYHRDEEFMCPDEEVSEYMDQQELAKCEIVPAIVFT